jgi:hypothetical protein
MENSQTHIEVPSLDVSSQPQLGQEPTLYDYIGLLPTLLVAATPLILGLRKNRFSDLDQKDNKENE